MNDGEAFKGGIHCVLSGLLATACLYNALEWTQRKELHSALNIGIYGGMWIFEVYQTMRHIGRT